MHGPDLATFAAERTAQQDAAILELRRWIAAWLDDFTAANRSSVLDAASRVFVEAFREQNSTRGFRAAERRFRESVGAALAQTSNPDEADAGQLERIATWLSVLALNAGLAEGFAADGGLRLRWVSRHDDAVRATHREADGQARAVGDTFDVGGAELRFPGDPRAPLDEIMGCRCILAPAGRRVSRMGAQTITADAAVDEIVEDVDLDQDDDDLVEVDIEGEDLVDDELDEIPVHGVLAPEGVPTGDGRMFAHGALTNRNLPLPIRDEVVGTHGGTTSDVITVGRIDEIWREGNEMRFRGVVIPSKVGAPAVLEGIVDGTKRGISVEVDDIAVDVAEEREAMVARIKADMAAGSDMTETDHAVKPEMSDEQIEELVDAFIGDGTTPLTVFSQARIAGFTIVPIPAYQEAYIALGHAFEDELTDEDRDALAACGCADVEPLEFVSTEMVAAAGTKDGPGWLTHPRATARIRRYWTHGKGAAKIRWGTPGDFNRCRRQLAKYVQNPEWLAGLCANMHQEALGFWPGQEGGNRGHALLASVTPITLVAAATPIDASYFREQENPQHRGIVIDGDLIYGYVAQWGVCHIGMQGACTTAPTSKAEYGYFRTGYIETTEGEIAVGQLTMGTGHADGRAGLRPAASHYDNTGACFADVVVGENGFGIWYSGRLREDVTDRQKRDLVASGRLSGDWRRAPNKNLELVAALAVNVPGFMLPPTALAASGGMQTSLVAAGIIEEAEAIVAAAALELTPETIAAISRNAVAEYRHQEKREERLEKIKPLREEARAHRIRSARALIPQED